MRPSKEVQYLAKILWDFNRVDDELQQADLIFGLGSLDIRTAERSAELFHEEYAQLILFSGGDVHKNDALRTTWDEPEADIFARRAIELGVPSEKILRETKAANTGDNIRFGYELLQENNLSVKTMILVQKPFMGLRTYATFKKQWPGEDIEIMVTSPQITFEEYFSTKTAEQFENEISIIVGDTQRLREYPKKGYQVEVEVPDEIWQVYEKLVSLGYNKHLIRY